MSPPQATLRVRGRLVPEPVPVSSREERAPGRALLLRTIETYVIGATSYRLVVPGYVPSQLDAEFRRTSLYRLSETGAIGAGPMLTFEDRHQALRWLAAPDLAPASEPEQTAPPA